MIDVTLTVCAIAKATMSKSQIYDEIISEFPAALRQMSVEGKTRVLWQIEIVVKNVPVGGRVVDLGAGAIPFMAVLQRLGYKTTIIDDFGDDTLRDVGIVLDQFRRMGVEVRNEDILAPGFTIGAPDSIDMVTTHDSMEHWHNSPKRLFRHIWQSLKPCGTLWVGVPNAVNLRKRLTVPFGRGSWSHMRDWYEQETFRGHVREPVVADLHYIARDLKAARHEVLGRNWLGYINPSPFVRSITPFIDVPLRLRPSLCSDIYVLAHKGETE
jgi:SAM-dependent methyltransferase